MACYRTEDEERIQRAHVAIHQERIASLGQFYSHSGIEVTHEEAADLFGDGGEIHVPNARAGSYHHIFRAMGYTQCSIIDDGSSAGDWSFAISDGHGWYIAFQTNRHPGYGFSYARGDEGFASLADAEEHLGV